jgi:hypothetical protein
MVIKADLLDKGFLTKRINFSRVNNSKDCSIAPIQFHDEYSDPGYDKISPYIRPLYNAAFRDSDDKYLPVILAIKDWNQEQQELWQYEVVENNPELFDPPGLVHVGQGFKGHNSGEKGNCYKHHPRMKERSCTPLLTSTLRDKFRDAQDAAVRKTVRVERKAQSLLEEELQQQRKFERKRRQDDYWDPLSPSESEDD